MASPTATWFPAKEEQNHAMQFVKYLQNNDILAVYETIQKLDVRLSNKMDPLKVGLGREKYVTGLIHAIYEIAFEDRDFWTMQFLDWFVKEQNEEDVNVGELVKKMELFGDDARNIYLLNSKLAGRRRSVL